MNSGYGCILDEDGNIIVGAEEANYEKVSFRVSFRVDSFGGQNADYAYFCTYIYSYSK